MSDVTDSERAGVAAGEAIVGAVLCIARALLTGVHRFVATIGFALPVLGVARVALGLGLGKFPGDGNDRERDDRGP